MAPSNAAGWLRAASDFLDDHWVFKWFVVPIWFMASVLLALFLGVSTASTAEILQVVGLYVAGSLGVVAAGLVVERLLAALFGVDVLHSRTEYD